MYRMYLCRRRQRRGISAPLLLGGPEDSRSDPSRTAQAIAYGHDRPYWAAAVRASDLFEIAIFTRRGLHAILRPLMIATSSITVRRTSASCRCEKEGAESRQPAVVSLQPAATTPSCRCRQVKVLLCTVLV